MKTQTKALIASLIVVALSLSAVSGVTYSWWSDSQNSTISVSTGYVKASTSEFEVTVNGAEVPDIPESLPGEISLSNGLNNGWVSTSEGGKLNVCSDPDNLELMISYKVKFEWSIPYKYKIDVSVPGEITSTHTITDVDSGNIVDGTGSSTASTAGYKVLSVTLNVTKIPANYTGEMRLKNVITQYNAPDSGGYSFQPFENHGLNQPYVINTAEELMGFAYKVNVDGWSFSGETVELGADIDLAGVSWTPIGQSGGGSNYNVGDGRFAGTFDGKGKKISNLNVDIWRPGTDDGKYYSSGLFGWTTEDGNTVIKDVILDRATVKGHHYTGAICGWFGGGIIEGCIVQNSTLISTHLNDDACGDKVGGIVGFVNNSTSSAVKDCTVKNTQVSGARDVGQIIGCYFGDEENISNNTVNSVTIGTTPGCTDENHGKNVKSGVIGRTS